MTFDPPNTYGVKKIINGWTTSSKPRNWIVAYSGPSYDVVLLIYTSSAWQKRKKMTKLTVGKPAHSYTWYGDLNFREMVNFVFDKYTRDEDIHSFAVYTNGEIPKEEIEEEFERINRKDSSANIEVVDTS